MTIGKLISQRGKIRAELAKNEEAKKKIKARYDINELELIAAMEEEGTDTGRTRDFTATRIESDLPQGDDWEAAYRWIRRNNMFELLHRRISSTVWKQLVEDRKGRAIPGIGTYTKVGISLRVNKGTK